MRTMKLGLLGVWTVLLGAAGAEAGIERSAAGLSPSDIAGALDAFRLDLGALNPNNPGSVGAGRREINWDGVPDAFSSPNLMPGDFFNGATPGRARGVVFSTAGGGFTNSADSDNPTATPRDFADIDPSYAANFEAFSPQRLFTPIGSNVLEVNFFVPGASDEALSRGFGVIFSDVDLEESTRLTLFDRQGGVLYDGYAPSAGPADGSFSFLGVSFSQAIVARARIESGTAALGAGVLEDLSAGRDLAVMDDVLFGEPVAVPEPASLVALGLALALSRRRA